MSPAALDAAEALLVGLTPAQTAAVTSQATPLCILAGAGTGKTRVLTHRIAHRVATGRADASHVLALTFTRKAAGELTGRLGALGLRDRVGAGTFHSVASAQLRRWWADEGRRAPALLERPARLIASLAAERPALRGAPIGDLTAQIAWARCRLVSPDDFEAASEPGRRGEVAASEVAALYRRYEHEKHRRGLVDFDDLLWRCADAMEAEPRFADAQRWRWRHVFVDEFQDVNPLQHRLLLAWLGASTDLCVVGDPNQAIYGWNGADPTLLDDVARRWAATEVVRLDDNFRCTPQIVTAGAAVLGPGGATLVSRRPDGPTPTVTSHATDAEEASAVAAQVRGAHTAGRPWSHLAVLVRTNAQGVALRRAFTHAGIPHRAVGAHGLLDHPAVVEATALLSQSANQPIRVAITDLRESALTRRRVPDPDGWAAALDALGALAGDLERMDARATVGAFLGWLPSAAGRHADGVGGQDTVTLCSFHRAKGLEWPVVWLCGLERGLVPIGPAVGTAAEAEERRLLYVAVTRAADELHCSWARRRDFGGHLAPREASPWLGHLCEGVGATDVAPPITVERWRELVADQRQRLRAGSPRPSGPMVRGRRLPPADPEVVDRLKAWRAEGARAVGVPAHVLLHDRILEALACLRPSSTAELLAVPGLGPVTCLRHGAALLALVSAPPGPSPEDRRPLASPA